MNLYITSLLIFAIPANLTVWLIVRLGRKEGLKWSVTEYLFIYLTWILPIGLANFMFGGLENTMQELGGTSALHGGMFVLAGIMGGLSFLPRYVFSKHKLYPLTTTSISSLILSTFYLKFAVIVFFFMS
ncbi:MAG: hypothetical protein R8K54_04920 [Mariprofundaceae bacterium]